MVVLTSHCELKDQKSRLKILSYLCNFGLSQMKHDQCIPALRFQANPIIITFKHHPTRTGFVFQMACLISPNRWSIHVFSLVCIFRAKQASWKRKKFKNELTINYIDYWALGCEVPEWLITQSINECHNLLCVLSIYAYHWWETALSAAYGDTALDTGQPLKLSMTRVQVKRNNVVHFLSYVLCTAVTNIFLLQFSETSRNPLQKKKSL